MSPKLRHYSVLPVLMVRTVAQKNPEDAMLHHTKPRGLWVSDEADETSWSAWCESEGYGRSPLEHEVVLADHANVLRLANVDDIDAFGRNYGMFTEREYFRNEPAIRWGDVANDYDGILITPYQWQRRMHEGSSWYYGWDCASGCIWNARAVAKIEPVVSPAVAAEIIDRAIASADSQP